MEQNGSFSSLSTVNSVNCAICYQSVEWLFIKHEGTKSGFKYIAIYCLVKWQHICRKTTGSSDLENSIINSENGKTKYKLSIHCQFPPLG